LLSPADFKPVFDRADVKASHRHGLILAKRSAGETSRLGLVIAKKHVRRAVQRNRIKRQVREHFRHHPLSSPCDIVFLARPGIGDLDNPALRHSLALLWQRLETGIAAP
jgi:ribonuclease P protein component